MFGCEESMSPGTMVGALDKLLYIILKRTRQLSHYEPILQMRTERCGGQSPAENRWHTPAGLRQHQGMMLTQETASVGIYCHPQTQGQGKGAVFRDLVGAATSPRSCGLGQRDADPASLQPSRKETTRMKSSASVSSHGLSPTSAH